MKKNAKKMFVILLLAVVACGSYFISGTYAKYSRSLSGSDEATVAKFAVTASYLNKEQNAVISLFDTVKEFNTTDTEENVASGKIAPGTGGQFTTTLKNDSEVDVEAVITLSETNTENVPIEYSVDGTNWKKADAINHKVALDYTGKENGTTEGSVTIYWRWAFEGTASANYTATQTTDSDTKLGEATTAPKVTTTVTVTFTQVN